MAISTKINGDLQRVSVLDAVGSTPDSPIYTNPINATFVGTFLTATTIQVTSLNGTITGGDVIRGGQIPVGTLVVSYVTPVLTIAPPASEPIPASAIGDSIPMATATPTNLYTANKAVQSGGPKLDYYTLNASVANKHSQVIDVIQQKATVHVYQVANATAINVGYYPSGVWGADATEVQTNLNVSSTVPGLAFLVTDGATFNT